MSILFLQLEEIGEVLELLRHIKRRVDQMPISQTQLHDLIVSLQADVVAERTKNDAFIADVLAAFTHLEAKIAALIAAGSADLQPEADLIADLKQKIADQSTSIDSPDAQAKTEASS